MITIRMRVAQIFWWGSAGSYAAREVDDDKEAHERYGTAVSLAHPYGNKNSAIEYVEDDKGL
jgi:hypothetical protein